jgi:hypothetical protein
VALGGIGGIITTPLCPAARGLDHVRTKEYIATPHFPAGCSRVRTKPPARVSASLRPGMQLQLQPLPRLTDTAYCVVIRPLLVATIQ